MNKSKAHFNVPDVKKKEQTFRRLKKSPPPIEALKQMSSSNVETSLAITDLEAKRSKLLDLLEALNDKIASDNDLLTSLRTRYQNIAAGIDLPNIPINPKENIISSEEVKQIIKEISFDNVKTFLQSRPLIFEDFYNNTDIYLQVATAIDPALLNLLTIYGFDEIELMTKSIEAINELSKLTQKSDFLLQVQKAIFTVLGTKEVTVLALDSKSNSYIATKDEKTYFFDLNGTKSFSAKALQDQEIFTCEQVTSSPLFNASIDSVLNPTMRPVMVIPVGHDGVLYCILTDPYRLGFETIDIYTATFFSQLLQPILREHNEYIGNIKSVEQNRSLHAFKSNLLPKTTFSTLLPFLYETLSECLGAGDIELMMCDGEYLFMFEMEGREVTRKRFNITGMVATVVEKKEPLVLARADRFHGYDESIDKWTLNKSFGAFPILTSQGDCIAVLCISDKLTGNRFSQWDIDFMKVVCNALSLVLPRCTENDKTGNTKLIIQELLKFPGSFSNKSPQIIYQDDIYFRLSVELQELIQCEYLLVYKMHESSSPEIVANIRNCVSLEYVVADEEFAQHVLLSGSLINAANIKEVSRLRPLEGVTYSSILAVPIICGEDRLLIIAINCTGSFDRFADEHIIKVQAFGNLMMAAMQTESGDMKDKETIRKIGEIKHITELTQKAFESDDPLESLLRSMAELLKMEEFGIYQYVSAERVYEPLILSMGERTKRLGRDDKLVQAASIANGETVVPDFEASRLFTSGIKDVFGKFTILAFTPLMPRAAYILIFVGNDVSNDSHNIFKLMTPLIGFAIKGYSTKKEHKYLAAANQTDIIGCRVYDIELSNRLFNVYTYTENQKVEIAVKMFQSFDLLEKLQIRPSKFVELVIRIRDGYSCLPYHNFTHAVDSLQFVFSILYRARLKRLFSAHQLMGIMLGIMLHDIGHDGLGSAYHEAFHTKEYYTYGPSLPLEHFHAVKGASIIRKSEIADSLNSKDFWEYFNSAILATNLDLNESIKKEFEVMTPSFDVNNNDHRILLVRFISHCANFCATTRTFDQATKAADGLMEELMKLNKIEEEKCWLKSKLYKTGNDLPEMEAGFIREVVGPLLKLLGNFAPEVADFFVQMEDNRKQWERRVKR